VKLLFFNNSNHTSCSFVALKVLLLYL